MPRYKCFSGRNSRNSKNKAGSGKNKTRTLMAPVCTKGKSPHIVVNNKNERDKCDNKKNQ